MVAQKGIGNDKIVNKNFEILFISLMILNFMKKKETNYYLFFSLFSGGFYSLSIRPGFRVIVLNTNYCARLNFWSLYDPKDPADHSKWLIKELLIAEQVGDGVHIVAHIPPDDRECTQAWIYNFLAVVERFKDTIVAQFYGHTHADEFRVFFSNNNISNPIGYGFIGPSLTTYRDLNPGYRIYTTDQKGIKNWRKL